MGQVAASLYLFYALTETAFVDVSNDKNSEKDETKVWKIQTFGCFLLFMQKILYLHINKDVKNNARKVQG